MNKSSHIPALAGALIAFLAFTNTVSGAEKPGKESEKKTLAAKDRGGPNG
jgi:hypothetical protein